MKTNKDFDSDINQVIGTGSSKSKKGFKIWIFIILVVVIAFVANGFRSKGKVKGPEFKTDQVRKGDITVIVTATGKLEPTNQVDVGSELSGKLERVDVDFNSEVVVDQILAVLDTSKLEAQVTQSKAALETANAKVMQANATLKETEDKLLQYKKVRELSDGKVPSQTDFNAAEASFERAKADLMSAKAAVSQAAATLSANETELAKTVIRSPINGIVLTRNVEKGQTVAASFETPVMFVIAEDLKEMELHVNVDEADIGKVKMGQKATFTVDAYPDRQFDAEITEIRYGSETVDGVVTYETVLKVDNSDLSLRPGMTATADIIVLEVKDTLIVSNSALRFEMPDPSEAPSGGGLVFAIFPRPPRPDEKETQSAIKPGQHTLWVQTELMPQSVAVTTGATDGVNTQIVEGEVKDGTEVIVDILDPRMSRG